MREREDLPTFSGCQVVISAPVNFNTTTDNGNDEVVSKNTDGYSNNPHSAPKEFDRLSKN